MSARPCTARVVHINTASTKGFATAGDMQVTCRCWKGQQGRFPCTTPNACGLPESTRPGWLARQWQRMGMWPALLGVPAFVISLALVNVYWSPAA